MTDTTNSINLVTATAYALPASVSSVTYGNGDVDSYTPDPNTGRITSFKNAIAASTPFNTAGTLTWNQNSTLHQFAWTDSNDSTKNQTCTYSADALNRLATANCGSVWNQTFAYDPFRNINKAANGGVTYNATYNTATNQVVSGPSANYDANGNQTLTNGVSSLAWDANHNPVTAGSTSMTYDALGRLVEYGGNHQILWGPLGEKLAVYSTSSTLATVFLPGGGEVYYTSGALTAVRHKDWLGSSRLATTWAHTIYSKTAYAPFGETYNTAGTSDQDFTGKTQDSVTTLADFPYRKFDSNAGRWTAPDPGAWSVVDQSNPQSLNRYAYVLNGPMDATDPLGLETAGTPPCPPGQNSCDPCKTGAAQCQGQTNDNSVTVSTPPPPPVYCPSCTQFNLMWQSIASSQNAPQQFPVAQINQQALGGGGGASGAAPPKPPSCSSQNLVIKTLSNAASFTHTGLFIGGSASATYIVVGSGLTGGLYADPSGNVSLAVTKTTSAALGKSASAGLTFGVSNYKNGGCGGYSNEVSASAGDGFGATGAWNWNSNGSGVTLTLGPTVEASVSGARSGSNTTLVPICKVGG